jgi:hypothetical protein
MDGGLPMDAVRVLKKAAIFKEVADPVLEIVAGAAEEVTIQAGETIVSTTCTVPSPGCLQHACAASSRCSPSPASAKPIGSASSCLKLIRWTQWIAVVIAATSCAGSSTSKTARSSSATKTEPTRTLPIPADLESKIQLSITYGRSLYLTDKASGIGTDVLLEKVPSSERVGLGGYITIPDEMETGEPLPSYTVLLHGGRLSRSLPIELLRADYARAASTRTADRMTSQCRT